MQARHSLIGLVLIATAALPARADIVDNAAFAFGALGFDLEGRYNPLSDGIEVSGTNRFFDDTLDFGAWELTLNGPFSFQFETGGRVLSQVDFSFGTSSTPEGNSVPLNYELVFDVGAQRREVDGTVFIDADFSHKGLGFYTFDLQVSSRQDITDEGVFRTGEEEVDFDLGPISVRGNIIADVLAVVTDPFFEAAGRTNIFDTLSGRAQLAQILNGQQQSAIFRLADGIDSLDEVLLDRAAALADDLTFRLLGSSVEGPVHKHIGSVVVPEPTVLVLMLLGVPAVLRRRSRRA